MGRVRSKIGSRRDAAASGQKQAAALPPEPAGHTEPPRAGTAGHAPVAGQASPVPAEVPPLAEPGHTEPPEPALPPEDKALPDGQAPPEHAAPPPDIMVSGRQFRSGQKRGSKVGKTKRGKGTKWMVVVDGQGIPLGKQLYSASPNEVRLAEETLASIRVSRRQRGGRPRQKPQRVIADRACDSDPLRQRLAARGIELVAPHRWNRSKPRTQDDRQHCAAIGAVGKWSARLPGSETFAVWSFATIARPPSMKLSFISPAS